MQSGQHQANIAVICCQCEGEVRKRNNEHISKLSLNLNIFELQKFENVPSLCCPSPTACFRCRFTLRF